MTLILAFSFAACPRARVDTMNIREFKKLLIETGRQKFRFRKTKKRRVGQIKKPDLLYHTRDPHYPYQETKDQADPKPDLKIHHQARTIELVVARSDDVVLFETRRKWIVNPSHPIVFVFAALSWEGIEWQNRV